METINIREKRYNPSFLFILSYLLSCSLYAQAIGFYSDRADGRDGNHCYPRDRRSLGVWGISEKSER